MYTNARIPDSVVTNEDYAIRAKELGHGIISGVEHGNAGRYIEGYELAKKHDLKFIFGTEAYWVKNRFEKDDKNNHIVLLAKNENGRQWINEILSEANISGFYYQPRLDLELIFSLPSNDVWVTSACVGFWKYEDADDIVLKLKNHFKNSFFLEVQYHMTEKQQTLNKKIIDLSNRHNIPIIMGCDSHYITEKKAWERKDYLISKKIIYPDEDGWFLDYPDGETAYRRFVEQGVLSNAQIQEAMNNTNIFLNVEEYHNPCFSMDIKMPTLYPEKTQEEKDKILTDLVWEEWDKEKQKIEQTQWENYKQEIQKELDIVITTKHSDYFLLDHHVIRLGKEMGGVITPSGRGSGVSFYINKLLGFTKVDRIGASVKMYPERFMSPTRILEAKTLADFDLNLANPEVFGKAQRQLLGENSSYPMIAYGTMKPKAAWKMYARAKNVDFETANKVSEQIEQYEMDLKQIPEDQKEELDVLEYVDKEYHTIFKDSENYLGIVTDMKIHPCAWLVYQGNIRRDIGLIKIKSQNGKENLCCVMDGAWAEKYKFLKNDLLKVSVVDLINKVFIRINQEMPDVNDLLSICNNDGKAWEIYKNALGMGINQVEQKGTIHRVAKYAPKNISELCAFVAAIRPGFKSMYKTFENRESFDYDIPSFDQLIQTPEMPNSFVLYQEQSMATLNYAGIPMSECYEIIKNIAKKRVEKVLKYKEVFLKGFAEKIMLVERKTTEEANQLSHKVWQILEDSSRYSFNASHSYCVAVDSLYGAYLKSHHPLEFYETFMRQMENDGDKDRLREAKSEAEKGFKIKFPPYRFGQDNRQIVANPKTNEIMSSLSSIKGFSTSIGEGLYYLAQFEYVDFIDFLIKAEDEQKLSKKYEDLIKIGYFERFGMNKKLFNVFQEFTSGKFRYSRSHSEKTKQKRMIELKVLISNLPEESFSIREQVTFENDILGYVTYVNPKLDKKIVLIEDININYSPKMRVRCLANGKTEILKVLKARYEENPILQGDVIRCGNFEQKYASRMVDGKWTKTDAKEWWISNYTVVDDIKEK